MLHWEKVAITTHCNLRPPVAPVILCLNYETHAKFEDRQPIRSSRFTADFLRYAVTLTFDTSILIVCRACCVGYEVIKLSPTFSAIEQFAAELKSKIFGDHPPSWILPEVDFQNYAAFMIYIAPLDRPPTQSVSLSK